MIIFGKGDEVEARRLKSPNGKEYLRIEGVDGYDPKTFIGIVKKRVVSLISRHVKPIKVKFVLRCDFVVQNSKPISDYFNSDIEVITKSADISEAFDSVVSRIIELVDKFQGEEYECEFQRVHVDSFKPISHKLTTKEVI